MDKTEFITWVVGAISFVGFSGVVTILGLYAKFVKRETTQNITLENLKAEAVNSKLELVSVYRLINYLMRVGVSRSVVMELIKERADGLEKNEKVVTEKMAELRLDFEKFRSKIS